MVEVQLELVAGGGDGLTARELQSLDQVLVADLGELAALIRVEVDVIDIEGRGDEVLAIDTFADRVEVAELRGDVPAEVAEVVELEVDADLVVLERDQRERKTRVAVEPELERDVQSVLRRALEALNACVGLAAGAAVVAVLATLGEQVRELGRVANHLGIAGLLARLLGELIPDLEPVAIVLVDALAANLELDALDKLVTNPVEPAELGARAVAGLEGD